MQSKLHNCAMSGMLMGMWIFAICCLFVILSVLLTNMEKSRLMWAVHSDRFCIFDFLSYSHVSKLTQKLFCKFPKSNIKLFFHLLQIPITMWVVLFENEVKWSEVAQSCLTLWDTMDRSLPRSSVHGLFQARVLEWVAIYLRISYWKNAYLS